MIEIRPIKESSEEYEKIERRIIELFKQEIYHPLIREFNGSSRTLKNSMSGLLEAIRSGRITFNRGTFSGRFNSSVSRELKKLGASFSNGAWKIQKAQLPIEVTNTISISATRFEQKIATVDAKLSALLPEELAKKLQITDLFDKALYKVDKQFKESVKRITVSPTYSAEARARIASEWQNNMDLRITDFTKKEIVKLRTDLQKSILAGNRYESAVTSIKKSYGVTQRKAKFLARQETGLLMAKQKEVLYADAGIKKYKWKSVTGTAAHPVRPMHKALNDRSAKGELFEFDSPPIDDPKGGRHNPGQNFNCRCYAQPVVTFK